MMHKFEAMLSMLLLLLLSSTVTMPRAALAASFDLEISESTLREGIMQTRQSFQPSDCSFHAGCIGGSGVRDLLLFDLAVGNNVS